MKPTFLVVVRKRALHWEQPAHPFDVVAEVVLGVEEFVRDKRSPQLQRTHARQHHVSALAATQRRPRHGMLRAYAQPSVASHASAAVASRCQDNTASAGTYREANLCGGVRHDGNRLVQAVTTFHKATDEITRCESPNDVTTQELQANDARVWGR